VISIKQNKFFLNNQRKDLLLGVLAGKMAARVGLGQHAHVKDFISFCQEWLGQELIFYTWLENGGWGNVEAGKGMFGSPPRDPGMWDVDFIKNRLWDGDEALRIKPKHLKKIYLDTIEWFFKNSETLGCSFMLGIIATLKHTDGIGNGHIDHAIATTLQFAEEMQDKYPKANVLMHACNEWDASHHRNTPAGKERLTIGGAKGINMWAERRADQDYFKRPNNYLMVDHGGRDSVEFEVSRAKRIFDSLMIHPVRKNAGRDWKGPPKRRPLLDAAHGMPLYNSENMYFITRPDTIGWYRNSAGYNLSLDDQMKMYSHWEGFYDAAHFHADWIMQTDHNWPGGKKLEAFLKRTAEMFGSGNGPPPPPPPPGVDPLAENRPYVRHVYKWVFGRDPINEKKWPAPDSGLEYYNRMINEGEIQIWELPYLLAQGDEGKKKLS